MTSQSTVAPRHYYSRPGLAVTALVCMAFGFYVAFGRKHLADGVAGAIFGVGAAACGLLFLIFLVVPTVRLLLRR